MPLLTYLNLGLGELAHTKLTVKLADRTVKHPKGLAENVLVGIELRRDQVDDLMPTIEEGEVVDKLMIEEVKARNDKMDLSLYTFRGRNELGNFANVPVFIGNFYVITDFTVVEYMDPYFDKGIGEVVVGEPFCEVTCVETKRFDGIITIHNEDDNVTYQMLRENLRFKHLTNEQCNKIPPLLKVSEQDKMNGISHPYQKLKGFYKGVLNLEPDFIRDPKMDEWLTRGHISVHEME
ncbi:hypothetical protein Tco_0931093 [Tanacetum coccineum]